MIASRQQVGLCEMEVGVADAKKAFKTLGTDKLLLEGGFNQTEVDGLASKAGKPGFEVMFTGAMKKAKAEAKAKKLMEGLKAAGLV